jgi:ATP-dependent DNA ligase
VTSALAEIRDAARGPAAAHQSLQIAAGAQPRAFGQAELVAEVKYLAWTDDYLLRQVVYEGLREDKPAAEVRRFGGACQNRRCPCRREKIDYTAPRKIDRASARF